jgi:O-antigen/teichoic acid export membrane protein
MKKLLLKNAITGVIQTGINFILLLVAIPVFIHLLGNESYGIFSLVMVVGNLNTFTNLGLSQALLKFLAEQGKGQESDHDIIVSALLLLFVLVPFVGAGIYFTQFILVNILGIPPAFALESRWLFIWSLMANFFIMLGQVPKAMLDSMQKIYITSWLQTTYSFIYWGAIILAVTYTKHLSYVGAAAFTAALIWFVAICIYALVAWNIPTCTQFSNNMVRVAQKQLSYGSKIYAGGLVSFFFEPLTKIMISHLIGVVEVGYFDIVLRIKAQIQAIFMKIFSPLMPLLAKWGNSDRAKYLIHDLEKKILLVTIPLSCIFYFTISPFLDIWLRDHSSLIDITTKTIVISFLLFNTSALPAYIFFLSCGHPQNTLYVQLANTVVNIVSLLILYKLFGFHAVYLSSAMAIFSSYIMTVYLQNQILGESIFSEYKYLLKIAGSSLLIVIIGYLVSSIIDNKLLAIFIIPAVIVSASLLLYRIIGVIVREDILYYLGKTPFAGIISKILVTKT